VSRHIQLVANNPDLTLVLGGARSGKSAFAQRLAAASEGPVLFVATGVAVDGEMAARIAAHRAARPADWRCVEAPVHLGDAIRRHAADVKVVLVDCLSFLVSNYLVGSDVSPEPLDETTAWKRIDAELREMRESARTLQAQLIVVSNEVGMSVVPEYPLGRLYRDLLGRANQEVAREATMVFLMVAGIPVDIKALGMAGVPPPPAGH
jgi:adenosylcobinamide kinase/adenosylcobinamide-phosphate guanylyltransferase